MGGLFRMKINNEGLALIKSFEGCRLVAYDDLQPNKTITSMSQVKGTLTIGYGHVAGVTVGQVITQAQADNMLKSDMKKYEKYVTDNVKIPLNENQFSALVSFCYNCGVGNLRTLVRNRTTEQIADAMILYNKASGKVLNGLVRRRTAERKLFLTPVSVKTVEEIAREVLDGKWGNGAERKRKITQAGYNYSEVQAIVNKLVRK
jgi:GH24 family phage-related lysozyme (muramidase)